MSTAHERYDRFSVEQVAAIPASMLRVAEADAADPLSRPQVTRHDLRVTQCAPAAAQLVPITPARPLPAPRPPQTRLGSARPALRQGGRPSGTPPAPQAPRTPVTPRPLSPSSCVGRRVLCPRHVWPNMPCDEHGGSGWEATIIKKDLKLDAQSNTKVMCALLQWVAKKRGTRGGAWRPTWIHLAVLQPLI